MINPMKVNNPTIIDRFLSDVAIYLAIL